MRAVVRTLYLGYYLRRMDWTLLKKFMAYVKSVHEISVLAQWRSILWNIYRYNISILEYYQFRFFMPRSSDRSSWAGTGFMYEYQRKMNPVKTRQILDDKRLFHQAYKQFMLHQGYSLEELEQDPALIHTLLANPAKKLVFKEATGKCGVGILIRQTEEFTPGGVLEFMRSHQVDLVETFLIQHSDLQALAPSAVNTVRIITQLDSENNVDILGCRLRISVHTPIDNFAAGNLAAPIDLASGIVIGPGVYSDITKLPEEIHPLSGMHITGFQIPYWQETVQLAKHAALAYPQNRSIGWDIVVTESGPGLIEGNHDWCKLLWQLPVQTGLKPMLDKYV